MSKRRRAGAKYVSDERIKDVLQALKKAYRILKTEYPQHNVPTTINKAIRLIKQMERNAADPDYMVSCLEDELLL